MPNPSRIVRLVRKNGTRKWALTIGEHRFVLSEKEAISLSRDGMDGILGERWTKEVLRKDVD